MRWFVRILVVLIGALLLLGSVAVVYVQRSFPALDGQLRVATLAAPVQVQRDSADVTHIRASNAHDAWRALGFVHAQERTWQLEFNRRVMHGTLSEVLGPATLETDKLMRALDIRGAARRQYAGLPLETQAALQAYSAGIAAFHAERTQALPPEFLLLGVRPGGDSGAVWAPEDSVGWALMMALDLGGNWGQELARLRLLQRLDTAQLWQLLPPYPGEAPATAVDLAALYAQLGVHAKAKAPAAGAQSGFGSGSTTATALPIPLPTPSGSAGLTGLPAMALAGHSSGLQRWAEALARGAGHSEGKGSNNWVLDGTRTTTGKPLLANDPHLGLSAPAIWYMAHLQAPAGQAPDGTPTPALDVLGATLPGLPFVVLGRTAGVAWSFTNTNPDVQDLYLEQIDPQDAGRYRTPDGWAPFAVRLETVRVKGQADVQLRLRSTRHGPVLSDAQAGHAEVIDLDRHVLALRWAALDGDNQTVLAGFRINQAQTVGELWKALETHHSPMQSVLAADTQGGTGFRAMGRVPLRHPDNDLRGVAPAPGWLARYDWQGWLAVADLPRSDGGGPGWLATANQRITAPGYAPFLTGDWSLPYRYERIAQQLQERPLHDAASLQALQHDQHSQATVRLLPWLRRAASSHPLAAAAQAQLQGFDGTMDAGSAAPLIFAVWADELVRGLVAPRLGAAHFAATYGKRDYRAGLEGMLERNDPWWCQPTGCAQHTGAALDRALTRLQSAYGSTPAAWRWGTAHPARSIHRPLGSAAALAPTFSVSLPSGGDAYTVNAGQYDPGDAQAPFVNRHAASLRTLYDLADLERSQFIYQTGQSGLVFSPRYRDMAAEWTEGRLRPLQREPARYRHRLALLP